jgi:hypothetical protein
MITIRTANFTVEGSVKDILSLFRQLEFAPSIDPVEEPPTATVVRDDNQTTLTAYEAFKRRSSAPRRVPWGRSSGQLGMKKADYGTGRKVHSCSVCGEPHRRMNPETGRCKSCPSEGVKQ